jgi:hypothetical protein
MPKPAGNSKQGQSAANTRAREALANQDERRAHRPLEGKTAKPANDSETKTGAPA